MCDVIVCGSVGSIIGVEFEDGCVLEDCVIEILICLGEVCDGVGCLDIGFINF